MANKITEDDVYALESLSRSRKTLRDTGKDGFPSSANLRRAEVLLDELIESVVQEMVDRRKVE